jgi:hypothetical protein
LHGALATVGTLGVGIAAAGATAGAGAGCGVAGLVTKVALGAAVAGVSLVIVSSGGGCDTPLYELGFCVLCACRQGDNAATPATSAATTLSFLIIYSHSGRIQRFNISSPSMMRQRIAAWRRQILVAPWE